MSTLKAPDGHVDSDDQFDEFEPSRTHVVIGINGSGKTRLLKNIMGMRGGYNCIYLDSPNNQCGLYADKEKRAYKGHNPLSIAFNDTQLSTISNLLRSGNFLLEDDAYFKEVDDDLAVHINAYSERLLGWRFHEGHIFAKRDSEVIEITDPAKLSDIRSEISPGQYSLLCFCFIAGVFRYKQETNPDIYSSDRLCFFLDEPEAHLHIKAAFDLIDMIRSDFPDSEIWVATHSTHIFSSCNFKDIVYVDEGIIQNKDAQTHLRIFEEMIGPERSVLYDHIDDAFTRELTCYLDECLQYPGSRRHVDLPEQVKKRLEKLIVSERVVRILDFGCGKKVVFGRYFKERMSKSEYIYDGIDVEKIDDFKELSGDSGVLMEGIDELGDKRYDLILLVNTLHEVDILAWVDTICGLLRHLDDDGILLFSEYPVLKYGERPTDTGYVVLGRGEAEFLFDQDAFPIEGCSIYPSEDPYFLLVSPSDPDTDDLKQRIVTALQKLGSRVEVDYKEAMKDRAPRRAAFYAVQRMNVDAALRNLGSDPSGIPSPVQDDERDFYSADDLRRIALILDELVRIKGYKHPVAREHHDVALQTIIRSEINPEGVKDVLGGILGQMKGSSNDVDPAIRALIRCYMNGGGGGLLPVSSLLSKNRHRLKPSSQSFLDSVVEMIDRIESIRKIGSSDGDHGTQSQKEDS